MTAVLSKPKANIPKIKKELEKARKRAFIKAWKNSKLFKPKQIHRPTP